MPWDKSGVYLVNDRTVTGVKVARELKYRHPLIKIYKIYFFNILLIKNMSNTLRKVCFSGFIANEAHGSFV